MVLQQAVVLLLKKKMTITKWMEEVAFLHSKWSLLKSFLIIQSCHNGKQTILGEIKHLILFWYMLVCGCIIEVNDTQRRISA